MSSSAKHKERQRRKRQEKRAAIQRSQGGSVYRRIGAADEFVACYVNRDWYDDGIAAMHLLKRGPGGQLAGASFLVDIWCMGLKDACGTLDTTMEQFRELIGRCTAIDLVRVEPAVVKNLVAGGIRFAKLNGFRLPHKYERWTAVLGPLPEPDMSGFGIDGKLRFVGPERQLRERLIGSTVEDFLRRPDVEFVAGLDGFDRGEEFEPSDDPELDEMFDQMEERLLDAARQWCFANGLIPDPRLPEAVEMSLDAIWTAMQACDQDSTDADGEEAVTGAFEEIIRDLDPREREELMNAFDQLSGHAAQYPDSAQMFAALGIEGLWEQK